MKALALIAILIGAGCGHYGPPERASEKKKETPPPAVSSAPVQNVSASEAAADEQCEEPTP